MRYLRGIYDGALRFADSRLEAFVGGLEESGLLRDTLLVVVADHGDEFLDHGGLGHGQSLYSELIRVPAIFFWPERLPAGRVVRTPVAMADLGVSILSLGGLSWDPELVSGRDVSGLIAGDLPDDPSAAPPVFSERLSQRAVVAGGHKYIFRGDRPGNGEKLFDLAGDSGEQENLMWSELEQRQRMTGHAGALLERIHDLDRRLGLEQSSAPMGQPTRDQLRELGYIE
jgi:arylsulfatase A-like enzyme